MSKKRIKNASEAILNHDDYCPGVPGITVVGKTKGVATLSHQPDVERATMNTLVLAIKHKFGSGVDIERKIVELAVTQICTLERNASKTAKRIEMDDKRMLGKELKGISPEKAKAIREFMASLDLDDDDDSEDSDSV